MIVEISVAINYILSQLYSKLPRRRVNCYGEELEKCLHKKFQSHWFPHDPQKDSSYRALHTSGPNVDLCFTEAAQATGLDWNEIRMFLPSDLVIEIDPGYVATCHSNSPSCSPNNTAWNSVAAGSSNSSGCSSASSEICGNGTKQILFSESTNGSNSNLSKSLDSGAGSVFNPEETFDVLSNGSGNNSLGLSGQTLLNKEMSSMLESAPWKQDDAYKSKSAPNTANWNSMKANPLAVNRMQAMVPPQIQDSAAFDPIMATKTPSGTQANTSFTAATFAQTKFGSTKLKNHSKRNKRIISPTEIQMNCPKDHEPLNNPRCELSSSKIEMLREALQHQQQMLNSADFNNQGMFNPNSGGSVTMRPDYWQPPPAPIGSNRVTKQSGSNMPLESFNLPNQEEYPCMFGGNSPFRQNDNQFEWSKVPNSSVNSNIWENNSTDEQNLLSFELSKLLSLDTGKSMLDEQLNESCHGNTKKSEVSEFDFNYPSSVDPMGMLWSGQNSSNNFGLGNPWNNDFSHPQMGPNDLFSSFDNTSMMKESSLSIKEDFDSLLGFAGPKNTDFGAQNASKLLTTSKEENA